MQRQNTPIQQLKQNQSSYVSMAPFRQSQFNMQAPRIDYAFINQSYKKLRSQQRQQLARLRMPEDLKRKIFNFKEDQDLSYEKPDLVIFNHPFRGKTVMTRKQVQAQLERQRKNAQSNEEKQSKGEKIQQNIFNEMGLNEEQIKMTKMKMTQPKQSKEKYPKKPNLQSKQPQNKIAQKIERQRQEKAGDNIYFIHKEKQKVETQKERTQKMKKLREQKQGDSKARKSIEKQGSKKNQSKERAKEKRKEYEDFPIIGQEPRVVRDIKYEQLSRQTTPISQFYSEKSPKVMYRPFGQQEQLKQLKSFSKDRKYGSGEGFLKKSVNESEQSYEINPNVDKSISEISAINDKDESMSNNSKSLNKALFLN